MKNDLVETVKFCFTRELISQLSQVVDEPERGVEAALSQSVPLVLRALLQPAAHSASPAALLELVRNADAADVLTQLPDVQSPAGHERSANLLLDLLGNTYRGTVNQIAVDAGIRPPASGMLLQVVATAVLGVLGKSAVENDLTPLEFMQWLQSQKEAISTALLPTTGGGTWLPPSTLPQRPSASPPRIATTPVRLALPRSEAFMPQPPAARQAGAVGARWQWGGLLLLAVCLAVCLGFFIGNDFFGRARQPASLPRETVASPPAAAAPAPARGATAAEAPAPGASADPVAGTSAAASVAPPVASPVTSPVMLPVAPSVAPGVVAASPQPLSPPKAAADASGVLYNTDRDAYIYDTGQPITLKLADGSIQKVGANSTENRFYTFLATAAVQVDSVNRTKGWINFDRVYFEPDKVALKPQSWSQLRNIANILRTFPNAVVRIGGYTDSAGVPLRNQELSEGRAHAAMMALANLGVPLNRLQSKGYGPRFFVASNATPAGRARNRRVSVRVVKK